jgi:hypothetical protein
VEQEQSQRPTSSDWIEDWIRDYGEQGHREPPPPPPPGRGPDLAPLFAIVDALRRGLPGELQGQFTSLLREVLLTIRSLIDWYLERLDRAERKPEVEDIPID